MEYIFTDAKVYANSVNWYPNKYKMKNIFSLLLILLLFTGNAQEYSTSNKKAIKLYTIAKESFLNFQYAEAEKALQAAIGKDSTFVEAYYLLAGTYNLRNMKEENLSILETCVRINGKTTPVVYYHLAVEQLEYGMYKEALDNFKVVKSNIQYLSRAQLGKVENGIIRSEFVINQMENPVPFVPKNMGPNINTEWDEYLPSLTADESFMIITSRIPQDGMQVMNGYSGQEDFFISENTEAGWGARKNVGPPINSKTNEGAHSMTADGKMFVFTACNRQDSYGGCDLYYSVNRGNQWSIPRNLGKPINTRYWESQPSLSADGRTLYFISNKPGGFGGMDIWVSYLDIYGEWTPPKNLGETINTDRDESSPFVHPDGQTMYFASNGMLGMGKSDVYQTRKNAENMWGEPRNLGYPINTFEDEQDLIVNAKGDKAFFSSDRLDGEGRIDIYEFPLYKDARPIPVTYVKGNIFDAKTKKKLEALFELFNVESGELIIQSFSDSENGEFLVPLPSGGNYALSVTRNGYLLYSQHFSLEAFDDPTKSWGLDIPLQPIEKGKRVVLNNVFFDTDSSNLKNESIVELNKLHVFLKQNPTVKIEIGGHTDNSGNKQKNITLSLQRAKSVYKYLVDKGIDIRRLSYKGYADNNPIVPNDTEENKALNRRTEFVIIEK